MLYKAMSPMGLGSLYALSFLLFHVSLQAQVQYVPAQFEHGDTISIDFSYGPATVGPVLTLIHDYSAEGFEIDPNSPIRLDLTNSPFASGTSVNSSYTIDHENELITITLERLDGSSVFVNGWTVRMGGVGVLIDDIQSRHKLEDAPLEFHMYPNPAKEYVILDLPTEAAATIRLLNAAGQVVRLLERQPFSGLKAKLSLEGLPAGGYWLQVAQSGRLASYSLIKI
ncbi:MAG: T9SS type A sorting domain-containing protein [Bacteroidota bacterium]